MGANIGNYCMYNVVTDEQISRSKNYQTGINHNWDWVSPKYTNWDLLPNLLYLFIHGFFDTVF